MLRRALVPFLLVLVIAVTASSPASAGRRWCRSDPTFSVAGKNLQVDIAVGDTDQQYVKGAIAVTLYVPKGVSAQLLWKDGGLNGKGETVSISETSRLRQTSRSIQVRVEITVPAGKAIAVQLTVTPAGGRTVAVTGRANSTVSAASAVPV